MKHCPLCNSNKPDAEFSKNAQNRDGLAYYCRVCNAAKQREWKKANPDKVKAWKQRYLVKMRERLDLEL